MAMPTHSATYTVSGPNRWLPTSAPLTLLARASTNNASDAKRAGTATTSSTRPKAMPRLRPVAAAGSQARCQKKLKLTKVAMRATAAPMPNR